MATKWIKVNYKLAKAVGGNAPKPLVAGVKTANLKVNAQVAALKTRISKAPLDVGFEAVIVRASQPNSAINVASGIEPIRFVNIPELLGMLESVSVTDSLFLNITKTAVENISIVDGLLMVFSKQALSVVNLNETIAISLVKAPVLESASTSELFKIAAGKYVADTAGVSDDFRFGINLGVKDHVTAVEVFQRVMDAATLQAVQAGPVEILMFQTSKPATDTYGVNEAIHKLLGLAPFHETQAVSESGVIQVQDYFSEDYAAPGYAVRLRRAF